MSVISMDFESQYLAGRHMIHIILPDLPRTMDPKDYYSSNRTLKVLWLLHGTFGDSMDWLRRSKIELYALEKNMAVVMPSGLNSDYVNWQGFGLGFNMYDYLFEELMPMIYNWFPISNRREDNFIAGLSMGGYGAMVYALNRPEKFAAAASLSAPLLDPRRRYDLSAGLQYPPHLEGFRRDRSENEIRDMGGKDAYLASVANTWDKLISCKSEGIDLPNLYFCCGTKDFLYPAFQIFREFAENQHYDDIIFEEEKGYAHEWRFWDIYIERVLNRFVPSSKFGVSF